MIFRPELLLESLDNPIPRNIYDSVVTYPDLDTLLRMLKDRKFARDAANIGRVTSIEWYTSSIKNVNKFGLTVDDDQLATKFKLLLF